MRGKNAANALCIGEYFNEVVSKKFTPKTASDTKANALVHRRAQLGQRKRNTFFRKAHRLFYLIKIIWLKNNIQIKKRLYNKCWGVQQIELKEN
jgi:hypothetical protein